MNEVQRDMGRIEQHLHTLDARDVACNESVKVVSRRMAFVTNLLPFLKALGITSVLDVGAAGITRKWWLENGFLWRAMTFPRDAEKLSKLDFAVDVGDVASMPYADGGWSLIYASHVLEHSPMPLVALLECKRVARFLAMAVPRWPRMVDEPYHYSCAPREMWLQWLNVAGWHIVADFSGARDYEFLCVKATDAEAIEQVKPAQAQLKRLREEKAKRKAKRGSARRVLRRKAVVKK